MKSHFSTAIATAAAAGLLGAVACGGSSTPAEPETPQGPATEAPSEASPPQGHAEEHAASEAKDCCKGMNDCKGKGGCAVDGKNGCQGQNECKGQGGCNHHCPGK